VKLIKSKTDFQTLKAFDVVDISTKNPYCPIEERASVQDAIDLIVKWKVYRLPVVNSEGELVTLLTQSHITSFLQKSISQFPFASKKLSELTIGSKDVYSVHTTDKTIDAFQKIIEKGVQGIAVVDENNNLVGNLSTTDVSVIGHTAKLLPLLLVPVAQFSTFIPPNTVIPGPIAVTTGTTIEEIMLKISVSKVHRVYVVNDNKPTGVVSLIDLLGLYTS